MLMLMLMLHVAGAVVLFSRMSGLNVLTTGIITGWSIYRGSYLIPYYVFMSTCSKQSNGDVQVRRL